MRKNLTISVIIPTYKRPKQLLRTLNSLQNQMVTNFEILVVDNNNDAKIVSLINKFNKLSRIPARYVSEPELGLHNARHSGAKVARGNLLIYGEDEITYSSSCIQAYLRAFLKHPKMIAAGGPLLPKWSEKPPDWLVKFVNSSKVFPPLSLMEPYQSFHLNKKGFFFGGNMAILKKDLFRLGGFNPEIFGKIWLGDGETGLNRKMWKQNLLIGYIPQALVYHHIRKRRMNIKYLDLRMSNEGRCDIYTLFHESSKVPQSIFELPKFIVPLLLLNFKYWLGVIFIKYPQAPLSVKLRMQSVRTISQLKYIKQIISSLYLQSLIAQKNWLFPNEKK